MEGIDFAALYRLQDRVLETVSRLDTGFYLSGGTCLHRFYVERRYSNDLDFFSNDNKRFREDVRILVDALSGDGFRLENMVDERDFVRLMVDGALKVDLVNDRTRRIGRAVAGSGGVLLDNIDNITANKICAVLGRDDPKDVFDLYVLFREYSPDWKAALAAAAEKCVVDLEILEFRLRTFPAAPQTFGCRRSRLPGRDARRL